MPSLPENGPNGRYGDDMQDRAPLAAFALMRVFLGLMWIYEGIRGAPWSVPSWVAGILLLIGLFTSLAATLGVIITLTVLANSHSPAAWGAWPWIYWLIILMQILVAATAAGRVFGIDSILARKRPRWPLW